MNSFDNFLQRLAPALVLLVPVPLQAAGIPDDAIVAMNLIGAFPGELRGQPKRLNVYVVRRQGEWVASMATPTNDGKPVWNTARMPVDTAGLGLEGDRVVGSVDVTLVPDPWVPEDQKVRMATVTVDARIDADLGLGGTWKMEVEGSEAEASAARLSKRATGELIGKISAIAPYDLSDASYDLALYNLVPGKALGGNLHRRRTLSLGVRDGNAVSARLGMMDNRNVAYDYQPIDLPGESEIGRDGFRATVAFEIDTLDGDLAAMKISLHGVRVDGFLVGSWEGSWRAEDGTENAIEGFFRGDVRAPAVLVGDTRDERPWFSDVEGFKAPLPGEHPRLFFRKGDVAELRRRAATPDGKKLVARLRELLNGSDGESMPVSYNPANKAYPYHGRKVDRKDRYQAVPGAYSISHGAGHGFLYQLTGDRKHADLARQCVERGFAGQRDHDPRYAWVAPGGELRAGPSIAWTAVAYDLCYDAWPEAFRKKVALALQNYNDTAGGEWDQAAEDGISLRKMVLQPRHGPGSNHFGAVAGGCGLAVLAILDDPDTDTGLLRKYLGVLERQVVRQLSAGWGDGGYYKEGWGASRVGTQGAFLCFLQALKVARGHDYLNVERANASYVTMVPRCLMVVGPPAVFPYRSSMGPTYGNPDIGQLEERSGLTHGGYFSEGFGAIADKHVPGLLWTYNHLFNTDGSDHFDTPSLYPHRPMLSLINWPGFRGIKEQNPAGAMPLVTRDSLYDYFVFRNRFRDENDIVTTVLINKPRGTKPRDVMVWGLDGLRLGFGEPPYTAKLAGFTAYEDGSGTLQIGDYAIAIDYSRASGAEALIVTTGEPVDPGRIGAKSDDKARCSLLNLGGTAVNVLTLAAGPSHPEATVEGGNIVVGGQTMTLEDGRFTMARTAKLLMEGGD